MSRLIHRHAHPRMSPATIDLGRTLMQPRQPGTRAADEASRRIGAGAILAAILATSSLWPAVAAASEHASKTTSSATYAGYLFDFDGSAGRARPVDPSVAAALRLELGSVTVDQPQYWPDETVHCAMLFPDLPGTPVKITLTAKGGAVRTLPEARLDASGALAIEVLDGTKARLPLGQYRVDVLCRREPNAPTRQGWTEFSVVEGTLGAVSLAHDFRHVTRIAELDESEAGWFLGNPEGAGQRWGNGLSVKNEVRVNNEPLTGHVRVKSRCMLPGCNGIEAGPPKELDLVKGALATTLDISSHSGPFEIEVITPRGSVRHLFEGSGHVEREMFDVSAGLGTLFKAGLAPYEGTRAVPGRNIFIEKASTSAEDPVAIEDVVASLDGTVSLQVRQPLDHLLVYPCIPRKGGGFTQGAPLVDRTRVSAGTALTVPVEGPWTLLAVGGFAREALDKGASDTIVARGFEGHACIFAPTHLSIGVEAPTTAAPLASVPLTFTVRDKKSRQGREVSAVVTVYDNRVASKDPVTPLGSCIGDSFRGASSDLGSRAQARGLDERRRREREAREPRTRMPAQADGAAMAEPAPAPPPAVGGAMPMAAPSPMANKVAVMSRASGYIGGHHKAKAAKMRAGKGGGGGGGGAGGGASADEESAGEDEAAQVREGEKKVVFSAIVRTGADGQARLDVPMPPQTGRCELRVAVADGMDFLSQDAAIDVARASEVECELPAMLMTGAKIQTEASCENKTGESLTLRVSGAGVPDGNSLAVKPGHSEVAFTVSGGTAGDLDLALQDARGRTLDRRRFKVRTPGAQPVVERSIAVSTGAPITIAADSAVSVFPGPGPLLRGLTEGLLTCIKSWFPHAEAVAAGVAARSVLLDAIAHGLIPDDGHGGDVMADIQQGLAALKDRFLDDTEKLVRPYPGLPASQTWTLWVVEDLRTALRHLKRLEIGGNKAGSGARTGDEGASGAAADLIETLSTGLSRHGHASAAGDAQEERIELPGDTGFVEYLLGDQAARDWVHRAVRVAPEGSQDALDAQRLAKVYERTGRLASLIQQAKVLWMGGGGSTPEFTRLFEEITRTSIASEDPGVIEGPALRGGIYSTPQVSVRFLELLLLMARPADEPRNGSGEGSSGSEGAGPPAGSGASGQIELSRSGQVSMLPIGEDGVAVEPAGVPGTLKAPPRAIVLTTRTRSVDLSASVAPWPGLQVRLTAGAAPAGQRGGGDIERLPAQDSLGTELAVGGEALLDVTLPESADPTQYAAIILLPATLAAKQTESALADYRGDLLYGQRASGGGRTQMLAVPFRATRSLRVLLEGAYRGASAGLVLVVNTARAGEVHAAPIVEVTVR